jgi:hypothetical protein
VSVDPLAPDERALVHRCSTPERVQELLDTLDYNWEADGRTTLRSLRRVLRDRTAHCLEGAVAAAAILGHHGYPPWMLYLDALDICHATFVYYQRDAAGRRLWGTVAMSRDDNLKSRPPDLRRRSTTSPCRITPTITTASPTTETTSPCAAIRWSA